MQPLLTRTLLAAPEALDAQLDQLDRWWSPDAQVVGGVLIAEGERWTISRKPRAIELSEDTFATTLRLDGRRVEVLASMTDPELARAWTALLCALDFAARHPGPMTWLSIQVDAALSFDDAWLKVTGLTGFRGLHDARAGGMVRLSTGAGDTLDGELVELDPPRSFAVETASLGPPALLRVQVVPGEVVNATRLDALLAGPAPEGLEERWQTWMARSFRPSWLKQVEVVS
ncbi:MAG: hypothetical protein H6739_17280 [Alphaproteobacteria bacterium]|nr:hypothetical protein [Alphaproteobacteria bacterium]